MSNILKMTDRRIEWYAEEPAEMPQLDFVKTVEWLDRIAASHGRHIVRMCYVFCNDEKILEMNRQFVHHDYYTDIITFDYCRGDEVRGEVYISLDTVASNAELLGQPAERELHRVIAHGLLHLCGIDDKGPGEREIMEANEDAALDMLA